MSSYTIPTDPVYFSMANPDAGNQAQIYIGVTATLNVTIVNNTGAAIPLQNGDENTASIIELFMPSYFTASEKAAMTITDISQQGWSFSFDTPYSGLMLTFGNDSGTWASGTSLTFTIGNVTATGSVTIGAVTVNLSNLNGASVPASLQPQNLALNSQAPPQSVDITTVLNLELDNQGSVYVSTAADPLSNTLFLNIKNIGANSLYNDAGTPWTGNPTVTVSFVYGNTAGALASAADTGTAWDISVGMVTNEAWAYTNPTNGHDGGSPVWILYPQQTNTGIIGTGDEANLTFAFSNINSFTPAGHTQMMVTFNNFMMNSTTAYESATFVLDISKQDPPPVRGLFSFASVNDSLIALTQPVSQIPIVLRWSMFYVDNVKMICNVPGVPVMQKNYYRTDQTPNIQPLAYDTFTLTIPMQVAQDTPVFITLQAFDHNNSYLNSLQFTVFITASFLTDPAGNTYPTVFLNNQTWLAANYNYGNGCVPYDNNSSYRARYGLLYTLQQAMDNVPDGWRIPSQQDWTNLIASLGANAFRQLMAGGSSGFNAQPGGMGDDMGNFLSNGSFGYYWTNTANNQQPGNNYDAQFSPVSSSVNVSNSTNVSYCLSIRYVKNS